MTNLLIISSRVHEQIAAEQLDLCMKLIKNSGYSYQIEQLQAGVYEIPFVINSYQKVKAFDAYIALGLIIKQDLDHFNDIMTHIHYTFSQFALQEIIVGNGIVSGPTLDEIGKMVHSENPCVSRYPSAFNAVDSLIKFRKKLSGFIDE